jgi:4-alpha-glucanotransferase
MVDQLTDSLLHSATGKSWEKIGVKTHHGINFPLSALRTANSCGIGEFFDLIPIIDWCHSLKLDFIQLLPLNNSNSESDPSPYNAISSCAINFLYLSLPALPQIEKFPSLQQSLKEFEKFNETARINYAEVVAHKTGWLRSYFEAIGAELLKSPELKQFMATHDWLKPYALFRVLKDNLNNISWKIWPEELRYPTPEKLQSLYEQYEPAATFYVLMQFLCYHQLKKVREYAKLKGVFLMGDIPILLSSESADCWQHPEYFDHHLSAGAPPDMYNSFGQNWGFPIFNWDALRKNHFSWWKTRLSYSDEFFDLFRLDHVIGFFRIWAIPPFHHSKDGYYIPENEKEWEPQGRELLGMIADSTAMLPIAEDLGTVPVIVRPILKEMGICSTKVMRWERNHETDKSYIPIQHYPPISLTCVSTHDSETLTLWWKNFEEEVKAFATFKKWPYAKELTEGQRQEILWDSHHTSSLFHANLLQEYLALFPELIWPDPEDERINVPGTISNKNWSYRFRPSVETIVGHKELFSKMEKILYSLTPT